MLLGLSAMAAAAVPSGMATLGDDQTQLDVRQFASSPDGQVIVAVTEDEVAPIAGSAAGTRIPSGGIIAADVSNAGWLALAHSGGVTIHDDGGRELLRLGGYGDSLSDIALSPDGRTFAVATTERITLHNAADGQELWSWKGQTFSVTYHPSGDWVITGIPTGNLVLDAVRGRVVNGFDTEPAVWFEWTNDTLYTHEEGGLLKTWDPTSLQPLDDTPGLMVQSTAAIHPDRTWMLVDGCVTPMGAMRSTSLCVDSGTVASIFDPSGSLYVATAGVLRKWSPLGNNRVTDLGLPPGGPPVTGIAAADGGDWVVTTDDGVIRRLAADGTAKFEASVPGCSATGCKPRAVGGYQQETWALGPDGEVQVWSSDGSPTLRGKSTSIIDVGRLPDGTWVSLMRDGRVRQGKKPGKGKPSAVLENAHQLGVGIQGYVVIGDRVTPFGADGIPRTEARLGPNRIPRGIAVDESGLAMAVLDDQGTIHRFSSDGRPVFRESVGAAEGLDDLVWSADGAWLVVGGSPIRVFDATDGSAHMEIILSPPGQASGLATSAFGFLGVVQGSESRQEVRLVRLR